MAELTVSQLIERLALDATNHRQLADELDAKADSLRKIHDSYVNPVRQRVKRAEPTVDTLIAAIKARESTRATHLAEQFGVEIETVQRIIDGAKDRIKNKGAGWLAVVEISAANNQPAEETPV